VFTQSAKVERSIPADRRKPSQPQVNPPPAGPQEDFSEFAGPHKVENEERIRSTFLLEHLGHEASCASSEFNTIVSKQPRQQLQRYSYMGIPESSCEQTKHLDCDFPVAVQLIIPYSLIQGKIPALHHHKDFPFRPVEGLQ
jgi:hypothetical protein